MSSEGGRGGGGGRPEPLEGDEFDAPMALALCGVRSVDTVIDRTVRLSEFILSLSLPLFSSLLDESIGASLCREESHLRFVEAECGDRLRFLQQQQMWTLD